MTGRLDRLLTLNLSGFGWLTVVLITLTDSLTWPVQLLLLWPLWRPWSRSFWLSWPLLGTTFGPKWLWLGRPDLLRPLKNTGFPYVFHAFQEIATFAIKSAKRRQNDGPDPSGSPVWDHFGPSWALLARLWAPRRCQRSLRLSILTSFWLLRHSFLSLAAQMSPRLASGAQNPSNMHRKTAWNRP